MRKGSRLKFQEHKLKMRTKTEWLSKNIYLFMNRLPLKKKGNYNWTFPFVLLNKNVYSSSYKNLLKKYEKKGFSHFEVHLLGFWSIWKSEVIWQ